MNEVTKIHLGRQVFTIAVDAHKALQKYLHEIEHESTKGVVNEVELRMAELLAERGIGADKVVILDDIVYLKNQLGEPDDFKEDSDDSAASGEEASDAKAPKRLFRDTEHGMIAGVAAGLAAYVGIDAVVVRLLFVLAVVTGGWGILVYLVCWLLMPAAKTKSDQLQMKGMAVTVDSLKEMVDRADVPGAAQRVTTMAGRVVGVIGKVVLGVFGAMFVIAGLAASIWTVVIGVYMVMHGGQMGDEIIFPIGGEDMLLLLCAVVTSLLLSALLFMMGITMIRRKWALPGWALGVMVGVFFLAISVGTALGFDSAPRFQAKYRAMHHAQTSAQPAFSSVSLHGPDTRFSFKKDVAYAVEVHYFGKERKEFPVAASVKDGTLSLDTTKYQDNSGCTFLCLYNGNDLEVIIHAPSLASATIDGNDSGFTTLEPLAQQTFSLSVTGADAYARVGLEGITSLDIDATANNGTRTRSVTLTGKPGQTVAQQNWISVDQDMIIADYTPEVSFKTTNACPEFERLLYLTSTPQTLTINGHAVHSAAELRGLYDPNATNPYNCVTLGQS